MLDPNTDNGNNSNASNANATDATIAIASTILLSFHHLALLLICTSVLNPSTVEQG